MRNLTIVQGSGRAAVPLGFDVSGPVLVEEGRYLEVAREVATSADMLTEGRLARAIVASSVGVARAAVRIGLPVVLEARRTKEVQFLEKAHLVGIAFWDDDTLRERLAWLLDSPSGSLDTDLVHCRVREASELRLWLHRIREAERRGHIAQELAAAAANEAQRREVERLEEQVKGLQARAEAAEERIHELGAHIIAMEGTRAWGLAMRLQGITRLLRGGSGQ